MFEDSGGKSMRLSDNEKRDAIKLRDEAAGRAVQISSGEEIWTGGYIFENEWQSFRTKKDRKLELTSAEKEVTKGRRRIAVKVVDIFGNDTTKVVEVNV